MGARDDLLAIPDADLRAGNIGEAALVFMDFGTGAKRWWTGYGDLDQAGHVWQGTGDLISIGEVAASTNLEADALVFSLAATGEMMALVQAAATAVRGRAVQVFSQMFVVNPDDGMMPWQPLGPPLALFSGTMEQITYAASGPARRQIQLTCESYFVRRNAPPRGQWSDSDQKARYPGDKGMERLPLYENYSVRWI
jgi:hypothetical protein